MIDIKRDERSHLASQILAFAAIYIIWGSTYLAIRFAIETIPPFLMLGQRFFIAGLLMYLWLRLRGSPRPPRGEWIGATIGGTLLLVAGTGAVAWTEQFIPSGLAALLVATVPMWVVLLDWWRPDGRRPTATVIAGLVLGLVGVALLVGPVDLRGSGRIELISAGVLMLAALSWAFGSVYTPRLELPRSSWMAAALQMTMAGVVLGLLGTAFGEWARFDPATFSLRSLLGLLYLIVFGSLIGFAAYVYLLKTTAPGRVASYAYVNPVVALFLGWALADEPISARTLIAAAIIIASVVMIVTYRSPARARVAGLVESTVSVPSNDEHDIRPLSAELFALDRNIRYVAVNQNGRIVEMEQSPRWPSHNSHDTDRLEELIVNPAVLDLTRRRGQLDLDGIRYVVVRYGMQYQVLFPYRDGHLSVGVESQSNVTEVARKVSERLGLPG